jgi:hypothetical protein
MGTLDPFSTYVNTNNDKTQAVNTLTDNNKQSIHNPYYSNTFFYQNTSSLPDGAPSNQSVTNIDPADFDQTILNKNKMLD